MKITPISLSAKLEFIEFPLSRIKTQAYVEDEILWIPRHTLDTVTPELLEGIKEVKIESIKSEARATGMTPEFQYYDRIQSATRMTFEGGSWSIVPYYANERTPSVTFKGVSVYDKKNTFINFELKCVEFRSNQVIKEEIEVHEPHDEDAEVNVGDGNLDDAKL